jgi:hypothetical protein
MLSRRMTDLKPGVFDAPLRGCGDLTSVTRRKLGIDAADARSCPLSQEV